MKTGVLYFAVVFAVGFALGPIRVLWAVPRFGERAAELLEAPFILATIVLAARWAVRRLPSERRERAALTVGATAVALLLVGEVAVAWLVRSVSLEQAATARDPVSGTVYLLLIALFGALPWWLARRRRGA